MTSDREESGKSNPTPNQVLPQDKGKGQSAPIPEKEEANDIQDGWVLFDERGHEEWEHGKWSHKLVDGKVWYSPEIWIPYAHEDSEGKRLNPLIQKRRADPLKIRTRCQELGLVTMRDRSKTPLARK